jgi:hypothetical protein
MIGDIGTCFFIPDLTPAPMINLASSISDPSVLGSVFLSVA